jgi:cobalt-zinc-cadmium efflux system outer membrane protein
MRRLALLLALAPAGCQAIPLDVHEAVESHVEALALLRAMPEVIPCPSPPVPLPPGPIDLPGLWSLALANNPTLREAAADLEVARGRLIQAGLYPNPRISYNEDTIGARVSPQGNWTLLINQEIVTGGKRRLDQAIAAQEVLASAVGLWGRKFDVLTRIRRGYYDYLGLRYLLEVNGETVAALERGIEITRRQVETARTRPQTDLLRLEALL